MSIDLQRPGIRISHHRTEKLEVSQNGSSPFFDAWSLMNFRRECESVQASEPIDIMSTNRINRFESQTTRPLAHFFDSFTALIPSDPEQIEPAQLIDFRTANELRVKRFRLATEQLLASFMDASTEAEANYAARLCGEALREEQDKLKAIYRNAKISILQLACGLAIGGPSVIGLMQSLLHVANMAPLSATAGLGLWALQSQQLLEKGKADINSSPWAYLWYLNKLK